MDVILAIFSLGVLGLLLASPFLINDIYQRKVGRDVVTIKNALVSVISFVMIVLTLIILAVANSFCGNESSGAATLMSHYFPNNNAKVAISSNRDIPACMSLLLSKDDNLFVLVLISLASTISTVAYQFVKFKKLSNTTVAIYLSIVMPVLSVVYVLIIAFLARLVRDMVFPNSK